MDKPTKKYYATHVIPGLSPVQHTLHLVKKAYGKIP